MQSDSFRVRVESTREMKRLGSDLAAFAKPGICMFFEGELGTGKTTLIQGIFRGLKVFEPVLSPTFSLLETYTAPTGLQLLHIDLYRIEDSYELYLIGLEEYQREKYAWFVEWPERGTDILPSPNFRINIQHEGSAREVFVQAQLVAETAKVLPN